MVSLFCFACVTVMKSQPLSYIHHRSFTNSPLRCNLPLLRCTCWGRCFVYKKSPLHPFGFSFDKDGRVFLRSPTLWKPSKRDEFETCTSTQLEMKGLPAGSAPFIPSPRRVGSRDAITIRTFRGSLCRIATACGLPSH